MQLFIALKGASVLGQLNVTSPAFGDVGVQNHPALPHIHQWWCCTTTQCCCHEDGKICLPNGNRLGLFLHCPSPCWEPGSHFETTGRVSRLHEQFSLQ